SQSIEEKIQSAPSRISAPERDYKSNRFLDAPRTETRWGNTCTWYRALIPTPVGDGVEMWMTPNGNTCYYITMTFNVI
ncbi:hypothetical protein FGX00_00315, partial [Xylella fastidiosa subsp. multiplex]|nr:hypothetical protein [Xylella fastidiosa subsp. multiplex]